MNKPPYTLRAAVPAGLDFTQLFMDIFSADLRRAHDASQEQPNKKPCQVIPIRDQGAAAAPVRSANPMTKEVTCSPSTCPSPISVD